MGTKRQYRVKATRNAPARCGRTWPTTAKPAQTSTTVDLKLNTKLATPMTAPLTASWTANGLGETALPPVVWELKPVQEPSQPRHKTTASRVVLPPEPVTASLTRIAQLIAYTLNGVPTVLAML